MGAIDLIVQQLCQIKYFILFISLASGVYWEECVRGEDGTYRLPPV